MNFFKQVPRLSNDSLYHTLIFLEKDYFLSRSRVRYSLTMFFLTYFVFTCIPLPNFGLRLLTYPKDGDTSCSHRLWASIFDYTVLTERLSQRP
jgi:hypothetical protein